MKQINLYFKSDFQAILASDAGWAVPFRLKFYTNAPSRPFIACYDGEEYHNCHLQEDGRLCIGFDNHGLGLGELMLQPTFYLNNECYRTGICDEAINPFKPVFVDTDGEEYTLQLSLQGATSLQTIGTLPAFYQKGEKGDKGDKGDRGEQGIQGAKGDKGDKGDRGEQGIQGVKGDTGATGATGAKGDKGEKGDKGDPFRYTDFTPEQLEGLRGPRGYQGETGPQGVQGIQGPKGDKGEKGDSITMFPNVTIFGQPTIQESQISNFSADNYLQFPFVVDFAGRPWQIDCAITTGSNVSQQHNVLDSAFGLAFAFSGGKFVLALSSDGTSWNLGATSGTHTILANTTYYIRISWNGSVYKLAYSTDKETWVDDITVTSSASLASKQIIIGKSLDNRYIFNGSINMAEAHLTISGKIVWEGMDDAGLATRMAIDLSNIDEEGKQRVNQIVNDGELGQKLSELEGEIKGSYDIQKTEISAKCISGTYVWATNGSHRYAKVYAGQTIRITPNETNYGYYALVKDMDSTGTTVNFIDGETRRTINKQVDIEIPEDCYLYMTVVAQNNVNYEPSIKGIVPSSLFGEIDGLKTEIASIDVNGLKTEIASIGYIAKTNANSIVNIVGGINQVELKTTDKIINSNGVETTATLPNMKLYKAEHLEGAKKITLNQQSAGSTTSHWFNQYDKDGNILKYETLYIRNSGDYTIILLPNTSFIKISVWDDNGEVSLSAEYASMFVKSDDVASGYGLISALGDSITYGHSSEGVVEKTYHRIIADRLGAAYQNLGVSSTPICPNTDYTGTQNQNAFIYRYENISPDADLILVCGGTNDFRHKAPLGNSADLADKKETTFYGALEFLISAIMDAHPNARLVFVTPFHQTGDTTESTTLDGSKAYLSDYIDAIKLKCRKYGILCIDGFAESGVNLSQNYVANFMTDSLHPNANGHKLIAKNIMNHFATL